MIVCIYQLYTCIQPLVSIHLERNKLATLSDAFVICTFLTHLRSLPHLTLRIMLCSHGYHYIQMHIIMYTCICLINTCMLLYIRVCTSYTLVRGSQFRPGKGQGGHSLGGLRYVFLSHPQSVQSDTTELNSKPTSRFDTTDMVKASPAVASAQ